MFAVIFEVHPRPEQWDAYFGYAKMLRPELEQVDGFVDNIRYRSLTRDGWLLSLSGWRDEKAVVRWRTRMRHHRAQEQGRAEILSDYHLRVGEITQDTRLPGGTSSSSSGWTRPKRVLPPRSRWSTPGGRRICRGKPERRTWPDTSVSTRTPRAWSAGMCSMRS
jgi:heme-degrading monooxygenase HmoA